MDGEVKGCRSPASTSCPAAGLGLDGLTDRCICWQHLALVLVLLAHSPPGPRQSRTAIHSTLNHFNHNIERIYPATKGDWSFNVSLRKVIEA